MSLCTVYPMNDLKGRAERYYRAKSNNEPTGLLYSQLMLGYKQHFGDKYEDMLEIMKTQWSTTLLYDMAEEANV